MKNSWITSLAAAGLAVSCSNQPEPVETSVDVSESAQAANSMPPDGHVPMAAGMVGPVLETMDAGGYTYVRIKTASGEIWAAGPGTMVEVGQVVEVKDPQPMPGFKSGSMNRTFDMIYFASALTAPGAEMIPTGTTAAPETVDATPVVAKAEGGQSVEEVIVGKSDWVGKEILLRAKVVKFTPDVMGKNWLHVQDGTGAEGTNDLTITCSATAAIGDIVVVKGVLVADKDFGFGYEYALIVEDADVTVEAGNTE